MSQERLEVRKMAKLFIGGAFVRTESERYDPVLDSRGRLLANVSRASKKDLREAVLKARAAFPDWAGRSAYNRGQVLYRVAEMLEGRAGQIASTIGRAGSAPARARAEVAAAVDTFVYYAGWTDKLATVLGSVNPVAASYFDFSVPEATGVVGVIAPVAPSLLGLAAHLAPVIASGNSAVALASARHPLPALELAEVLATSDVPPGVVNILSGRPDELLPHLARHRDVDAIADAGCPEESRRELAAEAATNVKRVRRYRLAPGDYLRPERRQGLRFLSDFTEIKTTWHPIGL